jgi:hypothetical protein
MSEASASSSLYYRGTQTEVRLGDRVRMKRILRSDIEGVVCYIPGISERHPEMEYADVQQWAIRADDGAVYPILYDPAHFQPPKHIVFLGRCEGKELEPDEVLE